jgi:hypothetical protein
VTPFFHLLDEPLFDIIGQSILTALFHLFQYFINTTLAKQMNPHENSQNRLLEICSGVVLCFEPFSPVPEFDLT